jgi:hypothetical protein
MHWILLIVTFDVAACMADPDSPAMQLSNSTSSTSTVELCDEMPPPHPFFMVVCRAGSKRQVQSIQYINFWGPMFEGRVGSLPTE